MWASIDTLPGGGLSNSRGGRGRRSSDPEASKPGENIGVLCGSAVVPCGQLRRVRRLVLNRAWKCPILSLGGRRETARVYCFNSGRSDRVAARSSRLCR
jgi:hypothetical protein